MKIFFIILVALFVLYNYYKLQKKISEQKRQLLLLSRENNELKSKFLLATNFSGDEQLLVQFEKPNFNSGTTSDNCKLYAAPIINNNILSGVLKNTPLQIQDSAFVNSQLWYEVSLASRNRINSKGWIKDQNLIIIDEIRNGIEVKRSRF